MERGKSKASKKSPKTKAKSVGKAQDLEAVRSRITHLVGGQAVDLVKSAIAEAGKGHFTAMKYLFEMIGLYPSTGEEMSLGEDSLARVLLQRMGLPEELALERPDPNGTGEERQTIEPNALK